MPKIIRNNVEYPVIPVGGGAFNTLIDYELYSSVNPNQFYSIPLPTNYSDYDLLLFATVQSDVSHDDFNESIPRNSTEILYIPTSSLTSTSVGFSTGIFDSSLQKISQTYLSINNTSLLGSSYPLAWQYLYLVCYGIKY